MPMTLATTNEPDVPADTISKLSPSEQIKRNDGSEAHEHVSVTSLPKPNTM